jgi:hypothetical protein
MMDFAYWFNSPLSRKYIRILRGKANGALKERDEIFSTAYLIASDFLKGDGVTLTEKGLEALEFYKRDQVNG